MIKQLKPLSFLLVLMLTFFAVGCDEDLPLVLDAPEEILSADFSSGEKVVSAGDLADYSGPSATQAFLDDEFGVSGSRSAAMDTAMDMIFASVDSVGFGPTSKSVSAFVTYGLNVEDEDFSPEAGYTVDINTATGVVSSTAAWDGEIGDFFTIESQADLFEAIGATDSSLLLNLDIDAEVTTDSTVTSGLKAAKLYLTAGLSIENEDVEFAYDETTYETSVSGTTTIQAYLSTSFGFTVSGESEGNAKYIVSVEMADVDVSSVALADLNDALEASESTDDVYDIIGEYFFDNADSYLTVTITAYGNDDEKIGSVEFDPLAMLLL